MEGRRVCTYKVGGGGGRGGQRREMVHKHRTTTTHTGREGGVASHGFHPTLHHSVKEGDGDIHANVREPTATLAARKKKEEGEEGMTTHHYHTPSATLPTLQHTYAHTQPLANTHIRTHVHTHNPSAKPSAQPAGNWGAHSQKIRDSSPAHHARTREVGCELSPCL